MTPTPESIMAAIDAWRAACDAVRAADEHAYSVLSRPMSNRLVAHCDEADAAVAALVTAEAASNAARNGLAAQLATVAWGRHPGGWFVTARRIGDGHVRRTLWRERVEVASVLVHKGTPGLPQVADPAEARARRAAERATGRQAVAAYRAALDQVARVLAEHPDDCAALDAASQAGELAPELDWLDFEPGQEGGTVRSGDRRVSARGALRRAARLRAEVAR